MSIVMNGKIMIAHLGCNLVDEAIVTGPIFVVAS